MVLSQFPTGRISGAMLFVARRRRAMTLLSYNTQDLLRTAHASDTRKQVAHQKLYASARSARPSTRYSCWAKQAAAQL
jgi:hypothetical protein